MIRNDKKIAVLLGTYNGERFLSEQLDSLLNQDCRDFRVFVHDDGSKDKTCEILSDYSGKYPDFITIIDGASTHSPKGNFLFLLKSVESDFYMFCDQDDIWHKNKIQLSFDTIQEKSKDFSGLPYCTFTDLCVTDSKMDVISDSFYKVIGRNPQCSDYISLLKKNVFVGCTMMFNKSLRDETIKIKDINNIPMHDLWVGIIASLKGKVSFIEEATINYRQHESNNMGVSEQKKSIFRKFRMLSDIIKIKKNKTVEQRKIALELMKLFEENSEKHEFFRQLSEISGRNKFSRLAFYKKKGLLNDGNLLLNILVI